MSAQPFIIGPVECHSIDDVLEELEFVAALALDMAKIDGDADQAELATIKGRIGMLRFKRDPVLGVA